ncbi:MAG: LamG-like jellyroll fold domain-containing protein [Planctomycetota bacterium]
MQDTTAFVSLVRVLALVISIGVTGGPTMAQDDAVAPVTHDRHTRAHNPDHPTEAASEERFHTTRHNAAHLALPTDETSFTFAVFGDRTGGPNEGIDILADAVADVNLLEPDLVMTVGDMIQGYNQTSGWLQQMHQYKEVMNGLLCPWFPVAGNHDVYWRGPDSPLLQHEANYELHFGPLWYSFSHKNAAFIVLYSDEGDRSTGEKSFREPELQRMSGEQFAFLEETLKRHAEADHIFVFLHHPRWIGGGYGEDWDRVHRLLVQAGNVSACFAGHIHRMRSDPRDGIEYITLATVGGHQRGTVPQAGFLHEFHMVTVRENQIALSAIPVGEVLDVRAITGKVSEAASDLAALVPTFASPLEVSAESGTSQIVTIGLSNPTSFAADFELTLMSDDPRWRVTPDHLHGRLDRGASQSVSFRVHRGANTVDAELRPLELHLGMDMITDSARFPIEPTITTVPGSLVLPAPPTPDENHALELSGDGAGLTALASVPVLPGPLTVEAWIRPDSFDARDGVIGSRAYGLWLESGRPTFYVRTGDGWFDVSADESETLEPGRWHHLAGVFDGEESRLYVNGRLVDDAENPGTVQFGSGALVIGADARWSGWRNGMNGWIDEVRISHTARYEGERVRPQRRLKGDELAALLLHMDGEVGGYLFDSSKNAAHIRLDGDTAVAPAPR